MLKLSHTRDFSTSFTNSIDSSVGDLTTDIADLAFESPLTAPYTSPNQSIDLKICHDVISQLEQLESFLSPYLDTFSSTPSTSTCVIPVASIIPSVLGLGIFSDDSLAQHLPAPSTAGVESATPFDMEVDQLFNILPNYSLFTSPAPVASENMYSFGAAACVADATHYFLGNAESLPQSASLDARDDMDWQASWNMLVEACGLESEAAPAQLLSPLVDANEATMPPQTFFFTPSEDIAMEVDITEAPISARTRSASRRSRRQLSEVSASLYNQTRTFLGLDGIASGVNKPSAGSRKNPAAKSKKGSRKSTRMVEVVKGRASMKENLPASLQGHRSHKATKV